MKGTIPARKCGNPKNECFFSYRALGKNMCYLFKKETNYCVDVGPRLYDCWKDFPNGAIIEITPKNNHGEKKK